MRQRDKFQYLDALYGDVKFEEPISSLQKLPVIQRLRQVRLSNIDSLSTPGVAGISRYEHALGTAYLASRTGMMQSLSKDERLCFLAAALLHDSAITPYGHLVEEAMKYIGKSVDHEERWAFLLSDNQAEAGGVDLQIYCGRESGLRYWAFKTFGGRSEKILNEIFKIIMGDGPLGESLAGRLDIDNLDNVPRAAYHMGHLVDKGLAVRIAQGMQLSEHDRHLVFSERVIPDIEVWLELRRAVYDRFMLSKVDFIGKIMLLSATISAMKQNIIAREDWKLADNMYIQKLLSSGHESVCEPLKRWLLGDLWVISPLMWFHGSRPDYPILLQLGELLSKKLKQHCFAYAIQDKRTREIILNLKKGSSKKLGFESKKWVLGVGSPLKQPFDSKQKRTILNVALEDYGWQQADHSSEQHTLPLFSSN